MLKDILLYILLLIFPKEEIYTKQYVINTSHIPKYIYWVDDINVLLSSYGYTQIYNTLTRGMSDIDTCSECIYGYDLGFVYCKYEHRNIQSMKEFSSSVYLYDIKGNLLFSKDVFPTVVPLVCTRDYILLNTAYSFLEQKRYLIDIKGDVFREYEYLKRESKYSGIQDRYITVSESRDLGRLIVLDEYYRLGVYTKK